MGKIISCYAGFVPYENIEFLQVLNYSVILQLKSKAQFTIASTSSREEAIDIAEQVADAMQHRDWQRIHIDEDGNIVRRYNFV